MFKAKWIICRKTFLEGKLTPTIARETFHSPEAVDNYILGLARVHFATAQQGMTAQEAAFALQQPLYLVEEYMEMIEAFGLNDKQVYDRADIQMAVWDDMIEPGLEEEPCQNERREQEILPIAG